MPGRPLKTPPLKLKSKASSAEAIYRSRLSKVETRAMSQWRWMDDRADLDLDGSTSTQCLLSSTKGATRSSRRQNNWPLYPYNSTMERSCYGSTTYLSFPSVLFVPCESRPVPVHLTKRENVLHLLLSSSPPVHYLFLCSSKPRQLVLPCREPQ